MKSRTILTTLLLFLAGIPSSHAQSFAAGGGLHQEILSLAGIWKCKLDPFETGISSNGVQLLPALAEEITLPGSTDQAGKGYKTQDMTSLRLTRLFEYKGPAWYEKEVYVPAAWQDKEINLFLERVHWESRVWVNGKPAGKQESLSVPHIYAITSLLRPGEKNTIRIQVNNEKIYDIEYSHAISAETQTNWNGIIGRIELQAFDQVSIEDVQVYPQVAQKKADVEITIRNSLRESVKGTLTLTGQSTSEDHPHTVPPREVRFSGNDSLITFRTSLVLGDDMQLWDEFNPVLYRLRARMKASSGKAAYHDSRQIRFGMREMGTQGTQFSVNGRTAFIRGTVNCAEFPLTGYPPTDVEDWLRIFSTCKAYGLNAMRFHSWCPPEAAFEAADQLGIYLQAENPDWRFTVGEDTAANRFMQEEAGRIFKAYGNHPSFMMFCEGNEMVGPAVKEFLTNQVSRWKEQDPRRLYTGSAAYPVIPENQFNVLYGARPQRWKEGLKGRFNARPLDTEYDYREYAGKHLVPMITHEVGQWCVYPDFSEIPKYTGVLKPYNYELFREMLRDHHMLDLAERFRDASGKFQVIQKKEEIESYLRTPGLAGYHLLQLNDFPGQGTSPVGVVDIFWDPKPYTSATEFSRFQAARVPLLRTASFTWTSDQDFSAAVEFANFGDSPLPGAGTEWVLKYPDGRVYARGTLEPRKIPLGSPHKLGELSVPLDRIGEATRMDLSITVGPQDPPAGASSYTNSWSIWVYPGQVPLGPPKEVMLAGRWDSKAKRHLQQGGKVILLADTSDIDSDVPAGFSGISWNAVWSGMPPNLLGILCDPAHPALKHFPTRYHSNWQWWDMVANSRPMVLDHTPAAFRPLVQMIPDWNKPRKIGLLLEAKVGDGSLLISGIDLKNKLDERPVARQMLYSLQEYVKSEAFAPEEALSPEMIDRLFRD